MIRIKVCGVRSADEAVALAGAGADAIGVIVGTTARSEHEVGVEEAAEFFRRIEEKTAIVVPRPRRVLVTHKTDANTLLGYAKACRNCVEELQLHGPMEDEQFQIIAQEFRRNAPWLDLVRAIHIGQNPDIRAASTRVENSRGAIAILLDSITSDRLGGTGQSHDWELSALIRERSQLPVILAGGLTPENVRKAVWQVRPDGIDVNTGTRPQRLRESNQSPARVEKLVQAVRQAEREIADQALLAISDKLRAGERVIFFVGAGASAVTGIPLGDNLRNKLLREFYPEAYSEAEALHRFRRDFGHPQNEEVPLELPMSYFRRVASARTIRSLFLNDFSGRNPSVAHYSVATIARRFPNGPTITLNQDDLFETAISALRVGTKPFPAVRVTPREWIRYTPGDLLKVHGEMARPETLIMSVDETAVLPEWKQRTLATILSDSTILFIGYSFRDRDILALLKNHPAHCYCVDPFVSQSFAWRRATLNNGMRVYPLGITGESALASMCRTTKLDYRAVVWSASSGRISGDFRDWCDEWNYQQFPMLWRKSRILGASPGRDARRDWRGGRIQFQWHEDSPGLERLRDASLAIHIPPGEGKGIHGTAGATVQVRLTTDQDKDIPAARFVCARTGSFQDYYAHTPVDRAPRVALTRRAVAALRRARRFQLALVVPPQCCVDMHEICLHLNDHCHGGFVPRQTSYNEQH